MSPKISEKKRRQRQDQIVRAACACFSRKGFHVTTIADICEESGLSTGAIYGHFENKDAIVRAVADGALEGLDRVLQEARAQADPYAGLSLVINRLTACISDRGEEGHQAMRLEVELWAAALNTPHLRQLVQRWYERAVPGLADLVGRAQRANGEQGTTSELVARSIVATIQGGMLQRVMLDDPVDLDFWPPHLPAPISASGR